MTSSTDRIVKKVHLKAPPSRVWRALTDSGELGQWFGVELHGPFSPGRAIAATFRRTFDEAALMEYQRQLGLSPSKIRVPGENLTFCTVGCIEPERAFSFRWIPYGIDADIDPQNEPTTLVELLREPAQDGTLLTIIESGFEQVPEHRRRRAFLMNEGGWSAQAESIRRHVERT